MIAKVDGDLSGEYDGLDEGDSVGRFKNENGGKLDLFITYKGGDVNGIELYTKSFFGVLPESLCEPRIIDSDDDSLTGTSVDEVIFGGRGDDVLLGGSGDDQVTGGNGDDRLDGGSGDDHLKGDRGADTYKLSGGNDVIIGFSVPENDRISFADGVELSLTQVGDDLLLTADGIHTTLLDVDKVEFLAAHVVDFI
ncbi:calcium-binding protein [Prochlorococcus sp. MIT 1201]|uniref:calcium-binding protein n=1 Tax=Prochlorococcus sp. MIT 1201 TaxID=3082535 RepID=UPI0039A5EE48